MPRIRMRFQKCIQDSQEYGSNYEHMVSRVFFAFDVNGQTYEDLYVDIKQTVGTDFESAPLEVGSPTDYRGPMNYKRFRQFVEEYYRRLVGARGSGIRIEGGADVRMYHTVFVKTWTVEFEAEEMSDAW